MNGNHQEKKVMPKAGAIFHDNNSPVGILLLHGFTSTTYQFKYLAEFLSAKGFTVYAPLIAGHGTTPDDLRKSNPSDWVKSAEAGYWKLKEKCGKIFIIGNSFGGNLAFALAKNNECKIDGLVSLGTPIRIRYQWLINLRYYTYGWLKKYYRKPRRIYKLDYTDMIDEITYPVIPIRSLRQFLDFIQDETILNLDKVKTPILIIHANIDPVVDPESAQYIHQHIGSEYKMIFWFDSPDHDLASGEKKDELFEKIYQFINEVNKNVNGHQ